MIFMHLGDLHLGKSLGEFHLYEDQKYILDEILKIIDQESVDTLFIAGDVYDKAIPSEAATNLLDYFLGQLAARRLYTFIISGNHDSDERLNYGSRLFAANQIYISSKYNGSLYKKTISDSAGEVDIYLLPFVKASQIRQLFPEDKIETYEDAIRAILSHEQIDVSRRNILVAHQFVAGNGENPVLGGSEGLSAQTVGLVEKIGYSCLDCFDYVALGHIHSPQRVGREEIRYSGSPLKYSFSEVNNKKTAPVVFFEKKNDLKIKLIPLKPMRDLRHLKGTLENLLHKKNVTNPEDFIYATLTDEEIINDAMGIFQQVYPNTVKIDYDNSHTKEFEQIDFTNFMENKSFSELIGDFYKMMYGCEISQEEMKIMETVAKEAGVLDETN